MATLFDERLTPEQLPKVAERALRIGRGIFPGDERRAKEFQVWFMSVATEQEHTDGGL
jgi:hypothetical protein